MCDYEEAERDRADLAVSRPSRAGFCCDYTNLSRDSDKRRTLKTYYGLYTGKELGRRSVLEDSRS